MKKQEFTHKLVEFITTICNESNIKVAVESDTYLFRDRVINSVRMIDIMSFIERELNIQIPDDKLTMNYFETPKKITDSFFFESS